MPVARYGAASEPKARRPAVFLCTKINFIVPDKNRSDKEKKASLRFSENRGLPRHPIALTSMLRSPNESANILARGGSIALDTEACFW